MHEVQDKLNNTVDGEFISEEKVVGIKVSIFELAETKQAEEIKDKENFKF